MTLLFERADWKLFRSLDTLTSKAGVSSDELVMLVIKELVDNALDAGYNCDLGKLKSENGFYIQDDGDGIDIYLLPELFSIKRPLVSSKLLRLPTRGALGNGLRVVTGLVTSVNGSITVETKGKKAKVIPHEDGKTSVNIIGDSEIKGTRIEVRLDNLTVSDSDFKWGEIANKFNIGKDYKGKTSALWYTSEAFYEIVNAYDGSVREVITQFDGCTGAKAGQIAEPFKGKKANDLTFEETEILLAELRDVAGDFNPNRLGEIGKLENYNGYHKEKGFYIIKTSKGKFNAEIPYIVECFANYLRDITGELSVLVNKSHIANRVKMYGEKSNVVVIGGNLSDLFKAESKCNYVLNVITPYMKITNDGKSPDLQTVFNTIKEVMRKASSRAKRKQPKLRIKRKTQKELVFENIEKSIQKASGGGHYRFSQRQLFYAVRPYILEELDKEPEYNYFCTLLTEWENEHGEIDLLYRDDRGTLYEPHTGHEISLGTLSVEKYNRPPFMFNKVLYSEKEGFFSILKSVKFPERYDIALLTSKGYASRAAKDIIDLLGETDEAITFYCIHDSDAAGTKIYESLQEATASRPERNVEIINLGLDPEEALDMDLEVEKVSNSGKKAVGSYLSEEWKDWLQNNRVELNAMTTPQFIDWLESKIQQYEGKIIPPDEVMTEDMKKKAAANVREQVKERILAEANFDKQVEQAVNEISPAIEEKANNLRRYVEKSLGEHPADRWDKPIERIVKDLI